MVIVIGEILMDIFPQYRRIGGAPFNFAYHLMQFGFPVLFLSRIGKDRLGNDILFYLETNQFNTDHIQIDHDYPTGQVVVTPVGSTAHQFEIYQDVAYDHIRLPEMPDQLSPSTPVKMIYFGTLIQRTPDMHSQLQRFIERRNPHSKTFYDVNLRPDCYSPDIIKGSLKNADILKLNEDELNTIRQMFKLSLKTDDMIDWLMAEFQIEWVALTLGDRGSALYTSDEIYATDSPPPDGYVTSVGAGDAYAAILAMGYLNKWSPQKILSVATVFASDICKIPGAIPDNPAFYNPFIQFMDQEKLV
jgi:fructokinase